MIRMIMKRTDPKSMRLFLFLIVCFVLLNPVRFSYPAYHDADADSILGTWLTEEKEAQIRISRCGNSYCGRVIWKREGGPVAAGHEILRDFTYEGELKWKGTIFNPKNGKTYKGMITLDGPDRLKLRGYVVTPLLGGTTVWLRVPKEYQ